MVGHIQIYDPGYDKLKRSLNRIGKIQKMIFRGLQSPHRTDSTEIENWGPHPIYLFLDIAAINPTSVSVIPTINNNIHMEFDFANDLSGIADIGSISPKKERELTVSGGKGSLTLDWSGSTKKLFFTSSEGIEEVISFNTSQSPLELEVSEFIDCIKTGREPRTPLSQGVLVMKIITEAQKSIT